MKGTILVDVTNQNTAYICALKKYYVSLSTVGSAVITKHSQAVR